MPARLALSKKLCRSTPSLGKKESQYFCRLARADEMLQKLQKQAASLPRRLQPLEEIDEKLFDLSQKATDLVKEYRALEESCALGHAAALQGRLAWAAGETADAQKSFQQAAEIFSENACSSQAAAHFRTAAELSESRGELKQAYSLLVSSLWQQAAGQPPELRRYCRSSRLNELCRRAASPIECARLEKKTVGVVLLEDFSRKKIDGSITLKEIEEVHRHGVAMLQLCLEEALGRGEIGPGDAFELFWAVTNEGGTDRFRLTPEDAPEKVRACLSEAVAALRYPRYRGQRQTVTIPLSVR
jgi:tetratricopeptide (TPR) repeat protein